MKGYKILQRLSNDFDKQTLINCVNNMLSMRSYVDGHRQKTGDLMYIVHCSRRECKHKYIDEVFDWYYSPQSHDYWRKIREYYL